MRNAHARLFLRFFVHRLSPAPFAVLLELNFTLDELTVFPRPIVDAAALTASEFYELIL